LYHSLQLPCSVNTYHAQYNASLPIDYGLFKTPAEPRARPLRYFDSWLKEESNRKPESWAGWKSGITSDRGLYEQFPSLETLVPLCEQDECFEPTEDLRNYYSPRPSIPGAIEVAVTAFTQLGYTEIHEMPTHATFNSIKDEVADFRFRTFPTQVPLQAGGGKMYSAPHPPLALKAFDLDGHALTYFSPLAVNEFPERSNRRLECFKGSAGGEYVLQGNDTHNSFGWPRPDDLQSCGRFFDGDGSVGPLFKFDFDFGDSPRPYTPDVSGHPLPEGPDKSAMFALGPEASLETIFCAGNLTHPPKEPGPAVGSPVCTDEGGRVTAAASGNLVFSQHVVNFADLPFLDVDNLPADSPYVATSALWYSQNLVDDPNAVVDPTAPAEAVERVPKGAMVSSILSAHACYAGSENQPPRFVRHLDRVPAQTGYVPVDAEHFEVASEHMCIAGEECVLPIFAQDFHLWANGCSNPDAQGTGYQKTVLGWGCRTDIPSPLSRLESCHDTTGSFPGPADAKFQSCDVVQVELAPGWGAGAAQLVAAHCANDASKQCIRDADCPGEICCTVGLGFGG